LSKKTLYIVKKKGDSNAEFIVRTMIHSIRSFLIILFMLVFSSRFEEKVTDKFSSWESECFLYLFIFFFQLASCYIAVNLFLFGRPLDFKWLYGLGLGGWGGYHTFHIVDPRPWPIRAALGSLLSAGGFLSWVNLSNRILGGVGFVVVVLVMLQWWRDIVREATFQGKHAHKVELGIRLGIILFIIREIFFFFSFFWSYFHSALRPSVELSRWPPRGVVPFSPYEVPLLNTLILLTRGATMTWAHDALIQSKWLEVFLGISVTLGLGIIFLSLQALEYNNCSFTIADSVYGSVFFLTTGFHGLHVLIGFLFIFSIWCRHLDSHFSSKRHTGFEASAWYWHFVDVVWLFLYIFLYCWGS